MKSIYETWAFQIIGGISIAFIICYIMDVLSKL